MDAGARSSLMLGLVGVVGLCVLGLWRAIPRALEDVDEKPMKVAPKDVAKTASPRWVKIRGHAGDDVGTIVTIQGRPAGDGKLVFRLSENPAVVVCSSGERRDDPAEVQTFEGLLVRLDDPAVEDLEGGWGCLGTHAPGSPTDDTVYLLDGWEQTGKGARVGFAFVVGLACLSGAFAVYVLWRRGRP